MRVRVRETKWPRPGKKSQIVNVHVKQPKVQRWRCYLKYEQPRISPTDQTIKRNNIFVITIDIAI